MKRYLKISILVILLCVVAGVVIGLSLYFRKHSDLSSAKPDFRITAVELQKEFEDNETSASSKYINKVLEVTGTISSVAPSDSGNFNVSLKTGSDLSSVICNFTEAVDTTKFNQGKEITLRGECSGFLMDVLLNNCALPKK